MKNKIYYIFIFLFLLVITAPFWGILLKNDANNTENRNLTKISNVKGIYSLNQYITDNHGFRKNLSNLCIDFYINILNESPIPDRVELAKNNLLFLGNYYNDTYNSSLGVANFKEDDVRCAYNNILEAQKFCEDIGVDFYLVIAPNKESIYPEFLRLKPNSRPRFKDELITKLAQTDLNFMDLTSFMIEQKQRGIMYYNHDSHWNNYGALLATIKIVDNISKKHNLKPINESNYYINKKSERLKYDLAKMINISEPENDFYDVDLKSPMIIEETILQGDNGHTLLTFVQNRSNTNGTKAFVIKDSFFEAMFLPFAHGIESASIFRNANINKKDIMNEIARVGKPDFILYEIVERNVNRVAIQ